MSVDPRTGLHRRGTTNRNARGGSDARRARKRWLLSPEAGFGGDGERVRCTTPGCQELLTFETVTVDRIKAGIEGGTYKRDNIRPKCGPHNYGEGAELGHQRRRDAAVVGTLTLFEVSA